MRLHSQPTNLGTTDVHSGVASVDRGPLWWAIQTESLPKGGCLGLGGRADPISPNLLLGFAARCSKHNLYTFSLLYIMF